MEPLVDHEATRTPPLATFLRPPLPEGALYGLPGDVVRAVDPHTEADPAALLLTFMTMFGNVIGPGPHVTVDRAPQPARLFTLLVGDAATGRKGSATDWIEDLFTLAEPDWSSSRILHGIQSNEGLIVQVDDRESNDQRLLLLETEFAYVLSTMRRQGTLSATLRNAYDGKTLTTWTRNQRRSLQSTRPHISVLAHITPPELRQHLDRFSKAGGLESRFLYAYVTRSKTLPPAGRPGEDVLAPLVKPLSDAVRFAHRLSPDSTDPISAELCSILGVQPEVELPRSQGFWSYWDQLPSELKTESMGAAQPATVRAATHIQRLAVAYALADLSSTVEDVHLFAAASLWSYCRGSAEVIFGIPVSSTQVRVSPGDIAKVIELLYARYPGWVTTTVIRDEALKRKVGAGPILDHLLAQGRIEDRRMPPSELGGPPTVEYRLKRLTQGGVDLST